MDLFKFDPGSDPTVLQFAESIVGASSIAWTERYREFGEFKIESPVSEGLIHFLPLGTLVSHSKTLEVMIVENHEMVDRLDDDPMVSISGRSLDSYLEHRVVGINQNWSLTPTVLPEYLIAPAKTWTQIVSLINNHIRSANTFDNNDALAGVVATTSLSGAGVEEERVIQRGLLSSRVMELLEIDDLGIRVVRKNTFGSPLGGGTNTELRVHKGADKTGSVAFTWDSGDLLGASYLRTNKTLKTAALVTGKHLEVPVYLAGEEYYRRMMLVDAKDLDQDLADPPTGAARTAIKNKMIIRGKEALAAQKAINITKADISDDSQYQYRRDYDIGDLVTVDGNYGAIETMRVVEFVETVDENGSSNQPTLAVL